MDELLSNDAAFVSKLMAAVKKGGAVKWPDFARLTGTSEATVHKAWKNGTLPSCPVESIPIREGIVALRSTPRCLRRSGGVPDFIEKADTLARELLGLPPRVEESADEDARESEIAELKVRYLRAQTAARAAQAQQKMMENDIKKACTSSQRTSNSTRQPPPRT